MDTNTIYEAFTIEGGRTHFYRWDLDQKIIVNDPNIDEVHFCNGTSDKSLVCMVKDGAASVPNILLQTAGKVKVYGYSVNHTRTEKIYEVKDRTKPDDYVYEETEVMRWAELDKRIQAIEEAAEPEEWELIDVLTVGENVASEYYTWDKKQKKLKLLKTLVEVEYAGDKEGALYLSCGTYISGVGMDITVAKVRETYSPDKKYAAMEVMPKLGYWDMTFYGAANGEGARPVSGMPKDFFLKQRIEDIPHINAVFLAVDRGSGIYLIPAGTVVRIWGVRATE